MLNAIGPSVQLQVFTQWVPIITAPPRRESTWSHFLQRDLREDLERRDEQAVLGENSVQRKIILD